MTEYYLKLASAEDANTIAAETNDRSGDWAAVAEVLDRATLITVPPDTLAVSRPAYEAVKARQPEPPTDGRYSGLHYALRDATIDALLPLLRAASLGREGAESWKRYQRLCEAHPEVRALVEGGES